MKSLVRNFIFLMLILALMPSVLAFAQEATPEPTAEPVAILPRAHILQNLRYEPQQWNNCGPATLTSALSYFGYGDTQIRAAEWLKPNREDKNVSPWQIEKFVDNEIPEMSVYAEVRSGGNIDLLKILIANDFPVMIEMGYDPEEDDQGWMGHYLFLKGYDDSVGVFVTNDSFLGENRNYEYSYIQEWWQHFNYVYIVFYESGREPELLKLLGDNADKRQNALNALQIAANEAAADRADYFAWFNMGTNLVALGEYERAVQAYDEAFKTGHVPWRMLWYQFGPFETYNAVGRYNDTIVYAQQNLNDGGGQYVEETFYYAGVAREKLGETQRAIDNYRGALNFNPNFTPAQEALTRLGQ